MIWRSAIAAAVLCAWSVSAESPTADAIMAKVAENQDRAQAARAEFVYRQKMLIRLQRGNGKLAREEEREYRVVPTENGIKKELTRFAGKYENKGRVTEYDKPGFLYRGTDIDGEILTDMADDLANSKKARDGIATGFPLSGKEQQRYVFHLEGTENYRGAEVYKINFKPKKTSLVDCDDDGNSCWSGEVLVDATEFQPVVITTFLAKNVPVLVQTLLGTNIRHLGFKLTYQKFDQGLWFPVTYGGEFEVKAVFFYKRRFAIALTNSGFQRSDVSSRVRFGEPVNP
ncbi:MAG: hypothetical protein HYX25_08460 [Candidatus Solibacter usitatus]|nr:hypothetical protein [Candidatus Solibacter usitatus]